MGLTGTAQGLSDDLGWVLGPDEGRGVLVPVADVETDVANEGGDFREGAAADRLAGEDSKPGFDQIGLGSALRGEVERSGAASLGRTLPRPDVSPT